MIANFSLSKSCYSWIVLYWMPYDNDLVSFGEPIIELLNEGARQSEVLVVVQSDYFGEPEMRRRIVIEGTTHQVNLKGEDSSDISAFSSYLDWAKSTFKAEHWAIIVLGHGGKINEVSPDDHGVDNRRTWMRIDQFTDVVSRFNQATGRRVELLFFQNCNRSILEILYQARNCAQYTLASQLKLGAPNYYYKGFLERLKDPLVSGRDAAMAIMEEERADMYHTLTLVNNEAVKSIPNQLQPLIEILLGNPLRVIDLSTFPAYYYFGERYCDMIDFFEYLINDNSEARNEFEKFTNFIELFVIMYHNKDGKMLEDNSFNNPKLKNLCGISLYFPENKKLIAQHNQFALYQETDLLDLYSKILTS